MSVIDTDRIAENMYEAASRYAKAQPARNYLGMSAIGNPCARALWYSFRQFTPVATEGRGQMIFSLGDAIEQEAIRWLELAGYQIEGRQEDFSALNGFFQGHCDGIIHGVTAKPHILEIKSANEKRFALFQKQGITRETAPAYAAQVQCYMGYAQLERALFVVVNKNNCEIHTERHYFDEAFFREMEAKAASIIEAHRPPERAFAETSTACKWCDYRGHCWQSPYVQERQTCGSCASCFFNGLQPVCNLHNREIRKWGRGCEHWRFWDSVDTPPF